MSAKRSSQKHERELREQLGALAFEYRGQAHSGHHIFVHPTAGTLRASTTPGGDDANARKQALRQAKRLLREEDASSRRFVAWLLEKYQVPEDGEKKVRMVLQDEGRQFINDTGIRANPVTLQAYASTKSEQVLKMDNKRPACYSLRGPLYGVKFKTTVEPEREEPYLNAVPDEGKPIQLIHRFDDTLKMYLLRADITTVEALEVLSVEELMSFPGMNRTRIRQVWAFFEREDPFDTRTPQIPPEPAPPASTTIKDLPGAAIQTFEHTSRVGFEAKGGEISKPEKKPPAAPPPDDPETLMERLREVLTAEMKVEAEHHATRADLAVQQLVEAEQKLLQLSSHAQALADEVHANLEALKEQHDA